VGAAAWGWTTCGSGGLWERRPRRDRAVTIVVQSAYRGEGGAGVSASTARRPQSRLAMQGQQWIAAPTGLPFHGQHSGPVLPTPVPLLQPIPACRDATLHKFSDAPPHSAGQLYTLRTTRNCPCIHASCNKPTHSGDFQTLRTILEILSHKRFQGIGSFFMSRTDYEFEAGLQRFRHLHSLTSRSGQRTEFFTANSPNGSFIGTTHFGRV
jgi:hypothetical protein